MSAIRLPGKRVVVTGAAGGLGRAFAQAFAAAGAEVIAADIRVDEAEQTARLIVASGGRACAAEVDVASEDSTTALARFAVEQMGGVDALVNNAAVYAGLERMSFEAISPSEWDRVMRVNITGVWMMSKAIAPVMRRAGAGAIINVSSATVMSGSPMWLHYFSSKGAVIAMAMYPDLTEPLRHGYILLQTRKRHETPETRPSAHIGPIRRHVPGWR